MLKIRRSNREEIECELMALLVNKNELLDLIQIKPKYLYLKENQKLLGELLECWNKYKLINIGIIVKEHKDFNFEWFFELLTEIMFYKTAWKRQMELAEESIFKYYKEDVINELNEKLKRQEITYDDFMKNMKKIDEIQISKGTISLTKTEMLENIADKTGIIFNNFKKLNEILKFVQGDFLIIGATTGTGKSGFLLNLMNDLMNEYQCIYFNMEMSKSTIYKRLIAINSNVPVYDVNNAKSEYQQSSINRAIERIEQSSIVIEHKANDIKKIKSIIAKLKNSKKHTIVFIDHLGLAKVEDKKSLYEQATEVAKELRQICLEYDCTIIGASQLNRSSYNADEISLNMLKDSGELENSASKVILLHKDKNSSKENLKIDMDIEIAKNRDGMTGFIKMEYDKSKQIFKELNNETHK